MNKNAKLTKRESQVAEYVAWGSTAKEIANILHISTFTVQNEIQSIKRKMQVHTVGEISACWFCTHYHISLDFSPLKRITIALIFLAIVIPTELMSQSKFLRTKKVETCRVRKPAKRGKESSSTNFYD